MAGGELLTGGRLRRSAIMVAYFGRYSNGREERSPHKRGQGESSMDFGDGSFYKHLVA